MPGPTVGPPASTTHAITVLALGRHRRQERTGRARRGKGPRGGSAPALAGKKVVDEPNAAHFGDKSERELSMSRSIGCPGRAQLQLGSWEACN